LNDIRSGYVILRIKAGIDAAGDFDIWRHLRSKCVELDHILTTAILPLKLELVESDPPIPFAVLGQIGTNVRMPFEGRSHFGRVVGVRESDSDDCWYRVEFPKDCVQLIWIL